MSISPAVQRIPDRPAPTPRWPPKKLCPQSLNLRFAAIRGLHRPQREVHGDGTISESRYVPGYSSSGQDGKQYQDQGRIFIHRDLDGKWVKNAQQIELKVTFEYLPTRLLPESSVVWSVQELPGAWATAPDDAAPTDEGVGWEVPAEFQPTSLSAPLATSSESTETVIKIDPANNVYFSIVRFRASNVAGRSYKILATVWPVAPGTTVHACETGAMTTWNRIDVEYVEMAGVKALPLAEIKNHYDHVCVQFDISRVTRGARRKDHFDEERNYNNAVKKCGDYMKLVFTQHGQPGWFCIIAAARLLAARTATVLYQGPARIYDSNRLTVDGMENVSRFKDHTTAKSLRIYDKTKIDTASAQWPEDYQTYTKFKITECIAPGGNIEITVEYQRYFTASMQKNETALKASLESYGFRRGQRVYIQVLSDGDAARVTVGNSPDTEEERGVGEGVYCKGFSLVFMDTVNQALITLCHELGHLLGCHHQCGNWDWKSNQHPLRAKRYKTVRSDWRACCMNDWLYFMVDGRKRKPIPWTQNRASAELCLAHRRQVLKAHLEDNPALGWGRSGADADDPRKEVRK